MTGKRSENGARVPSSRAARLAGFGALAAGLAGGMAAQAARDIAHGRRPRAGDMLLTPANAARIADRLANMRGAAMKIGQLLSMEAGDLLPREWSDILARLRSNGEAMPPRQLKAVLVENWGRDFLKQFESFDVRPIAAASIGQVHEARTKDGRDLAIKVQFPGVRRSIDSDVANAGALIRMSGLLPADMDIDRLLEEAARQLQDEADYAREGRQLERFRGLLADAPDVAIPKFQSDLSTENILAMTFVSGRPIEDMADAPQAERDRIAERLIALTLRELFEFRLMQTDPNFANFQYDAAARRLILLDFGAVRDIPEPLVAGYRSTLTSGLAGDFEGALNGAIAVGLLDQGVVDRHRPALREMFDMAYAAVRAGTPFDFGDRSFAARAREVGASIAADRASWILPPADALFVQRKLGGVYLIASRLQARVDLRRVVGETVGLGSGAGFVEPRRHVDLQRADHG